MNKIVFILVVLGLMFFINSANAGMSDNPNFKCGSGSCNFYLVEGGWSPHTKQVFIGGNAVDFVAGAFGVGLFGAHAEGDINFIGGVCAIPKVGYGGPLAFLCPVRQEGQ